MTCAAVRFQANNTHGGNSSTHTAGVEEIFGCLAPESLLPYPLEPPCASKVFSMVGFMDYPLEIIPKKLCSPLCGTTKP